MYKLQFKFLNNTCSDHYLMLVIFHIENVLINNTISYCIRGFKRSFFFYFINLVLVCVVNLKIFSLMDSWLFRLWNIFCLITIWTWKILLTTFSVSLGYLGPKHSTEDGYERSFGVNYLGHFYLTYLLKDMMAKCAPSRIINVTSDSYIKGKLEYDDLPMKNYDMYKAYARSKLALMHFTVEAHRLWYPDVVMSYAVQPGKHLKKLLVCISALQCIPIICHQQLDPIWAKR